ncbi:MAG: hypothetical protein NC184_05625 [Roseburia sp.]|nr:hypothetical protein [Roseburia sp.]
MPNEKNLKKYGKDKPPLSHEQAVENGKKGKKKSDEAKREKRTSREIVEMLDALAVSPNNREIMEALGIPEDLWTRQTLRLLQLQKRAESGDAQANKLLLEIRGEAAAATVNVEVNNETREAYDRAAAAIKGAKKK